VSNRGATPAHLIKGNDWSPLVAPAADAPAPSLMVTAVIAGATDQERLDLTLAALRHQDYPARLLEAVVLDSAPHAALELPKIRPDRTRIVSVRDGAFDAGVAAADGEIILRLDAGTICAPDAVSTLARWQHVDADAVSFATPRLVTVGRPTIDEVAGRTAADELDRVFPVSASAPDDGLVRLLERTGQLRSADHQAFLALAGTPFAFHRDRYDAGTDPHRGADIEVGYRLAQAGAVFVPEPAARVWALPADGTDADAARERRATLANLMPYPRDGRAATGRSWTVPLVTAVVPAGPYDLTRACVDRLLGSDETDLRVLLVGDGGDIDGPDQRLLAAEYRSDGRVRLVDSDPESGFPSPYLLRVPARLGVGPGTVRRIVAAAERWQVGLLRVLPAGAGTADAAIELWGTGALRRALRAAEPGGDLAATVAETQGQRWETGSDYDVVDLSTVPAERWESANADQAAGKPRVETVPVGGARSLGKATAFVARRYARAAKRRVVRR
jgi:hypothetical protein